MEQNIFLQEYFKIIYYFYQLKNTLNILVALLGLIYGTLMSEENIVNITKSGCNFAQTFVDYHLLSDTSFNRHCLMKKIFLSPTI